MIATLDTSTRWHKAKDEGPAAWGWLRCSTIGFEGGDPNLYRYVGNSAPNATDPTGLRQAGNPLKPANPSSVPSFPGADLHATYWVYPNSDILMTSNGRSGLPPQAVQPALASYGSIYADNRSTLQRWWDGLNTKLQDRKPLIADPLATHEVEIGGQTYVVDDMNWQAGGVTQWLGNLYHRSPLGERMENAAQFIYDPVRHSADSVQSTYNTVTNLHHLPEQWQALPNYKKQDIVVNWAASTAIGSGMTALRLPPMQGPVRPSSLSPVPRFDRTHPLIEGTIDSPRSATHRFLQQATAEEMQASGYYQRVGIGRPLGEFSGRQHSPSIRPDNIGLTTDGRIDMIEVLSPSQSRARLEAKLQKAMNQLPPEMRGEFRVINPKDAFQ
jgi:hypothetical protein